MSTGLAAAVVVELAELQLPEQEPHRIEDAGLELGRQGPVEAEGTIWIHC